MAAYYNEIDPKAAQWLRNLIAAGLIAPGDVDERSIADVTPDDLRGYTQCHFFAGLGGWSLALRRAGWRDSWPVWTGSCPCQPFSQAGAGEGFADERHLWPAFHWLIAECRPPKVLGEQVASKAVDPWIDLVQADLEGVGYTFGGVPFPSAGVGAPHLRDRLYWVANTGDLGWTGSPWLQEGRLAETGAAGDSQDGWLGHADDFGSRRDTRAIPGPQGGSERSLRSEPDRLEPTGSVGRVGDPGRTGLGERFGDRGVLGGAGRADSGQTAERAGFHAGRLADSDGKRFDALHASVWSRQVGDVEASGGGAIDLKPVGGNRRIRGVPGCAGAVTTGPTNGLWRDADWLFCRDGKWRPVEPGSFPLADGAPSRVVRLRAYGNAINVEAAKVFIEAVIESDREQLDRRLDLSDFDIESLI